LKPLKIAVLGAGYWGTKVAKEYAAIEETTGESALSWIIDSSAAAIAPLKSHLWTYAKFGDSYELALKDGVDAVHVALPNEFHFEAARAALNAGKHVLVEKPLATSSVDAFRLVALAKEKNLVLQVGHIFWFNNAVRMVKKIINEGTIGKVFYAKLGWATSTTPPPGRDIVFDLAPHPISILNDLLGEWPSQVDALGGSYVRGKERAEEMAFINLEFPSRVLANVYVSWIQHGAKERSVMVVGEKGTVLCDTLNQSVILSTPDGDYDIPRYEFPSSGSRGLSKDNLKAMIEPNNTIRDMQYYFIDSIHAGQPQYNNAMIGAKTVKVLEEITAAMKRKSPTSELSTAVRESH
jgi:UDP-N-acetylglucosamine 3-dehydrogenase